jgi:hypothetical protein
MRTRISAVIDGVASGAAALMNSASETLRELADDPVYFQTGEGSIEQYTVRNGKQPLMPLSQVLFYLRNNIENANTPVDGAGHRVVDSRTLMSPLLEAEAVNDTYTVYQTGERRLRVLVGQPNQPASVLYPGHQMGTPGFRMLYGVRGLLASKAPVDFEHMPGVRSVLAIYNGSVTGRAQLSPETYLASVQSMVGALRWVTDARCYKALISPYVGPDRISVVRSQYVSADAGGQQSLMPAVLPAVVRLEAAGAGADTYVNNTSPLRWLHPYWYTTKNGIIDDARGFEVAANLGTALAALPIAILAGTVAGRLSMFYPNAAYAVHLSTSLERTLQVVESSDQTSEIQVISKTVWSKISPASASSALSVREREQIQSLIEMNVIPVNVHALMRGIPLANIYNYEASFDQFAEQMLGEKYSPEPRNARQMLLKLLADPYCNVTARQYGSDLTDNGSAGYVHRIFRGDNGIGMGRPKFLSDQIFNKALFGSVYQSRHDWDEGGPLVGIGAARGRATGSLFLGALQGPMLRIFRNLADIQTILPAAAPAPAPAGAGPLPDMVAANDDFTAAMRTQGARYVAGGRTFFELTINAGGNARRQLLIAAINGMNGGNAVTLHTGFGFLNVGGLDYNAVRDAMGPTAHDRLIALLNPLDAAYNDGADPGAGPARVAQMNAMNNALVAIAQEAPSSGVILRRALAHVALGPVDAIAAGGGGGDNAAFVDAGALMLDHTRNAAGRQLIGVLALELLYRTVLYGGLAHNGKGVMSIIPQFDFMVRETIDQLKTATFSTPTATALQRWKLANIKVRLMRTLENAALVGIAGLGAAATVANDALQYTAINAVVPPAGQLEPAGQFNQGPVIGAVSKRSAIFDASTAIAAAGGLSPSIPRC